MSHPALNARPNAAMMALLLSACSLPTARSDNISAEPQKPEISQRLSPGKLFQDGTPSITPLEHRAFDSARVWISSPLISVPSVSLEGVHTDPFTALRIQGQLRQLYIRDPSWLRAEAVRDSNQETYTDQFGNFIQLHRRSIPLLQTTIAPAVTVSLPLQVRSGAEEFRPRNIDLRPLGGPLALGAFEDMPLQRSPGGTIVSTGGDFLRGSHESRAVIGLIEGSRRIESMAGIDSGNLVGTIYVVDSGILEAGCRETEPGGFVVSSKMLSLLSLDGMSSGALASHESLHLLDRHLEFPSRQPEVRALFTRITREAPGFFQAANETAWAGVKIGGHAKEDVSEFFVSTLHALTSEAGKASLEASSRDLTRECARVFRDALCSGAHPLTDESRLVQILRHCLESGFTNQ